MFIKSKLYLFMIFQIIFVTRCFSNAAESLYGYEQMLIEELMIDSLRYFQHNIDPNNLSKYDIEMINLLARIINRRKVLIPQNVTTRPLFWFSRKWRSIDWSIIWKKSTQTSLVSVFHILQELLGGARSTAKITFLPTKISSKKWLIRMISLSGAKFIKIFMELQNLK